MNDPMLRPLGTEEPRRIEREIELLRARLDELVDELDRRRHDAFDWRLQMRRHPGVVALGAGAALGALLLARRARRPAPLGERVATFARGIYAIGEDPRRLERPPESFPALATQLARTAALAGASALVRRFARRTLGGLR